MPMQTFGRGSKIPLSAALITPFVVLTLLAVGLTGYLSFRNGQKAVNNVAHRLRGEITQRIHDHLQPFLNTPHQINQANAGAIQQGLLDVDDPDALARCFWRQIGIFKSVTSIYFGNTQGGLVNSGREGATGSRYIIRTDAFKNGAFKKYAVDRLGNPTELLSTFPNFDARTRQWYRGAIQKGACVWSPVYILFTGQDMAISASRPVYDDHEKLFGVVSTDIFLSHISHFLQTLSIGSTGEAFIIERSGLLISSSTEEKPFIQSKTNGKYERIRANASRIPMIQSAAKALDKQTDGFQGIQAARNIEFQLDSHRHFVQALPLVDAHGLDWLIVVVIPQADFMEPVRANQRVTLFLIVLACALAVGISIFATRMIIRPIWRLQKAAQALGKGEWTQTIRNHGRVTEITNLIDIFNQMAEHQKQTLDDLTHEISERKQAQRNLEQSEARLRAAFESAQDCIFIWDKDYNCLYANQQAIIHVGASRDRIIGQRMRHGLGHHPDFMHLWMQRVDRVFETGEALSVQDETVMRGRRFFTDSLVTPVRDSNGRLAAVCVVYRDITAKKQVELELRSQKAFLDRIIDQSPFAIWIADAQGTIQRVNPALKRFLNLTEERLVGKYNVLEDPLVKKQGLAPLVRSVFEEGQSISFRAEWSGEDIPTLNLKGSRSVNIEATMFPIFDSMGKLTHVVLSWIDITKRVRAEEALRQSEQKLKTLFEAMTEMVVLHEVVLDDNEKPVNYRITDCNHAFTQTTGIQPADAIGKLATQVYQADTAPYLEKFSRVALTGEPLEFTDYYSPMDKHFMISVVSPRKGEFATITTDITAIKQIQDLVTAKNKELENYLYVASHDLRSPLINIQGFSQRLQKQTDSIKQTLDAYALETPIRRAIEKITDQEIPKTLNFIFTSVGKMDTLINGLLKISRTGRMKITIQKVDMNNLMAKIARVYAFQLEACGGEVVVDQLHDCYGDANLLNQLFSNLIGNAIQYRDKSRRLVVTVASQTHYNKVIYSIKDTGAGISPRHLEKIWDVFYRVDDRSSEGGEGIGLSIVKRITDKHKGRIWVESEAGRGSIFYVELSKIEFTE